jgi:hypothetical protein
MYILDPKMEKGTMRAKVYYTKDELIEERH